MCFIIVNPKTTRVLAVFLFCFCFCFDDSSSWAKPLLPPIDKESEFNITGSAGDVINPDVGIMQVSHSFNQLSREYETVQQDLAVLKAIYSEKQTEKEYYLNKTSAIGNITKSLYGLMMVGYAPSRGPEDPLIKGIISLGPIPVAIMSSNATIARLEGFVGPNVTQLFSRERVPPLPPAEQKAFNCSKECLIELGQNTSIASSVSAWKHNAKCLHGCEDNKKEPTSQYLKFLLSSAKKVIESIQAVYGPKMESAPHHLNFCPMPTETTAEDKSSDQNRKDDHDREWLQVVSNSSSSDFSERCAVTKNRLIADLIEYILAGCQTEKEKLLGEALARHSFALTLALNTDGAIIARCPNLYQTPERLR